MNFRTADTSAGRLAHLTGDEWETVKITALQLNPVVSEPAPAALIGGVLRALPDAFRLVP